MKLKNVVVFGGGTGTFSVLSGLKQHPLHLTAVVTMADDGGSTGVLRDELGVLPPGDVRQCLVALSESDLLMRNLMSYRFDEGGLRGHNFGNLLLSALEKVTGSFDAAVEKVSEILRLDGRVVPATLNNVNLVADLKNGTAIRGQAKIFGSDITTLKALRLEPAARANPKAIAAIKEADAIVIGPGDLYSSVIPSMLVQGIPNAIRKSKATKIYICNLMNRPKQTEHFAVNDFADQIERYLGGPLDYVIFNNKKPASSLVERYARSGEYPVSTEVRGKSDGKDSPVYVGSDLINMKIPKQKASDAIKRSLIRHDPERLASVIIGLIPKKGGKKRQ